MAFDSVNDDIADVVDEDYLKFMSGAQVYRKADSTGLLSNNLHSKGHREDCVMNDDFVSQRALNQREHVRQQRMTQKERDFIYFLQREKQHDRS